MMSDEERNFVESILTFSSPKEAFDIWALITDKAHMEGEVSIYDLCAIRDHCCNHDLDEYGWGYDDLKSYVSISRIYTNHRGCVSPSNKWVLNLPEAHRLDNKPDDEPVKIKESVRKSKSEKERCIRYDYNMDVDAHPVKIRTMDNYLDDEDPVTEYSIGVRTTDPDFAKNASEYLQSYMFECESRSR